MIPDPVDQLRCAPYLLAYICLFIPSDSAMAIAEDPLQSMKPKV